MRERNYKWLKENKVIYDELLLTPKLDCRNCIALTSSDQVIFEDNSIQELLKDYEDCYISPRIHHTFIVLRGWKSEKIPNEDWSDLKDFLKNLPSYRIDFTELIPVKTGLVLCGYPSFDINSIRDKIVELGYETDVLYHMDICHTTLVRWVKEIPNQEEWLNKVANMEKKIYARINVENLEIVRASWTMNLGTYEILDQIKLKNE